MQPIWRNLGFRADPFASTDAGSERDLHRYFVDTEQFTKLKADIQSQTLTREIYFGPRGIGKTAFVSQISDWGDANNVTTPEDFVVVYNTFDPPKQFFGDLPSHPREIFYFHLANINTLLLRKIIAFLGDPAGSHKIAAAISRLSENDRKILADLMKTAGPIAAIQNKIAEGRVRTRIDKALKWIWRLRGVVHVGRAFAALAQGFGFGVPEGAIVDERSAVAAREAAIGSSETYEFLIGIITHLGFRSLLILIDGIDEIGDVGNKPSEAARFIAPLLSELQVIRHANVCYKVFLWHLCEKHLEMLNLRRDAWRFRHIKYKSEDLNLIFAKRLAYFSNGKIMTVNEIVRATGTCLEGVNFQNLVIEIARKDPRRAFEIVHSATDFSEQADSLPVEALVEGIVSHANERVKYICRTLMDPDGRALEFVGWLRAKSCIDFALKELRDNQEAKDDIAFAQMVRSLEDRNIIRETTRRDGHRHFYFSDPAFAIDLLTTRDKKEMVSEFAKVLVGVLVVCLHGGCGELNVKLPGIDPKLTLLTAAATKQNTCSVCQSSLEMPLQTERVSAQRSVPLFSHCGC